MIAVLHYALLKSIRDRSLAIFVLGPALVIAASLLGATIAEGFRYPFYVSRQMSAAQNAEMVALILTFFVMMFGTVAAFWTFRPEVVTKTIGSFLMARRPLTVALAQVTFAAAVTFSAWIAGILTIAALTSALPPAIGVFAVGAAVAALAAASIGALVLTISPQPAMVLWAFLACTALLPLLVNPAVRPKLLYIVPVMAILFTAVSAFLLERRWAS
jgi:hypothetical protein